MLRISIPTILGVKHVIRADDKCSDCVAVILKQDIEGAEISQKKQKLKRFLPTWGVNELKKSFLKKPFAINTARKCLVIIRCEDDDLE